MDRLWLSLYHALAMLWATFWALVLGFTISGVLQVFVSKERMSRAFGRTNLKLVSIATGVGAASSSCSYAAVAAARSAMQQGATLVPALAFMFASTNLVIELGAVLWVLMGWQFVLAEIIGSFVLIALVWLMIRLFLPKNLETEIHGRVADATLTANRFGNHNDDHEHDRKHEHEQDGKGWVSVAHAFVMDWGDAVERNPWRICDRWIFGNADAASLVGSVIPPKRTSSLSDDRECGRRPDYRHALVRLFVR